MTETRYATTQDPVLASKVEACAEGARVSCAFAIDWRNRHIAHRDLALAIKNSAAVPLASASRTDVDAALKSIRAVLGLGTESLQLRIQPSAQSSSASIKN